MPHKEHTAAAVDVLAPAALALASVNTVVPLADGRLEGHSTDGAGFVASLRDSGCDPTGRRVLVFGAGAAARSVIDALARERVAEIVVVNRSAARADRAVGLSAGLGRVGTLDDVGDADIIVNATSVGMGGGHDTGPADTLVPARLLRPAHVVAELVYHPLETPLLAAARAVGAHTIDGLGMLVHQAALQQLLWLGVKPDTAVMRAAAINELSSRRTSPLA
jgi:shikimate dehydrogenase